MKNNNNNKPKLEAIYRIYKDFGEGYRDVDVVKKAEDTQQYIDDKDYLCILIVKHDFINNWDEPWFNETNHDFVMPKNKQKTRVKKR